MEPQPKSQQQYASRSNQIKRQREWVYLSHYLAITGLNPSHIISGKDDGLEPDFTLVFCENGQTVYIGIELTTLPRLRDQMGDDNLIAKRWYWQSLRLVAKHRRDVQKQEIPKNDSLRMPYHKRFTLPIKTIYMPVSQFTKYRQNLFLSKITQQDIDAVMRKKSHKVKAYYTRRKLDELWLLVHTDKYQPSNMLIASRRKNNQPPSILVHNSGFDNVHITRYPSHKVLKVQALTE